MKKKVKVNTIVVALAFSFGAQSSGWAQDSVKTDAYKTVQFSDTGVMIV